MLYLEFLRLSEKDRVRLLRRASKASERITEKKMPINNRDVEILNHCVRWLGGYEIVKTWEKRVFARPISKADIPNHLAQPPCLLPTC